MTYIKNKFDSYLEKAHTSLQKQIWLTPARLPRNRRFCIYHLNQENAP